MAKPEGYRKSVRLMEMADRFQMPVITLCDTAAPIPRRRRTARSGGGDRALHHTCLAIGVPLIAVIIGEGGSGGAVAIATANRILMLEHSIYTVASPEARSLDPLARQYRRRSMPRPA